MKHELPDVQAGFWKIKGLIGKDSDAGRDWGQEKGMTEDEMAGWHHSLNGRESEWTPGVGDGQGGLACCDSWGLKESDMTERVIWSDQSCPTLCMDSQDWPQSKKPRVSVKISSLLTSFWRIRRSENGGLSKWPPFYKITFCSTCTPTHCPWPQSQKTNQSDHMDHSLV